MELIEALITKDHSKCSMRYVTMADINDSAAIKLFLTSTHQPIVAALGYCSSSVKFYIQVPAKIVPISKALYCMEIAVFFNQRQYHVWFANIDSSLEDVLINRDHMLKNKSQLSQQDIEKIKRHYFSGIRLQADSQPQVTWQGDNSTHYVFGLDVRDNAGLII
jgi:hypothetical protein